MRRNIFSYVVLLGSVLSAPAWAQGTPLYVSPTGTNPYSTQPSNVPMYNSTGQPLPMEQMIAGKNAPSYNYNNNAYTGFGGGNPMNGVTSIGALTPEQYNYQRAQSEAQAAAYQNEYLASLQAQAQTQGQGGYAPQQPAAGMATDPYQGGQFSQLYEGYGQQQPAKPINRRVVYKERNNPLTVPPRLFNPDQ